MLAIKNLDLHLKKKKEEERQEIKQEKFIDLMDQIYFDAKKEMNQYLLDSEVKAGGE